jgi:hypothetical protein
VWVPGVAYSLAHVRGNHVYLGPSGINPSPGGRVDEEVIRGFFEGALSLALDSKRDGVDGIVVYVPEPLEPEEEEGEEASARVVCAVLEEAGFALQEVTTRMARPGGLPTDAGAGECALRDVDVDVPGDAASCLTVASLDLG